MKNNWLENFESKVSTPPNFQGEGYTNIKHIDNPAWKGQFQNGGKAPKYVESKNDPKYRAYQDSLSLYNKGINEEKEYNNFIKKNNIPKKVTRQWNNPVDDDNNINTKINPIQGKGFIYNHNPDVISGTNIPAKLSNNRVMIYKKPQQQVIVKDNNAPQYKAIYTGEGEGRFEPIQRQPIQGIQNNLQPAGLVQGDFNIDADAEIHPEVRRTKYYDVEDYTHGSSNYTGNQTNYRTSDLSSLEEQSPNNTRKITPHYQMGGSIPGAVSFSYARTKSIPSNGKYAKKTMASAQNGKEMQYYQEGLDWQPKTISQNGSWLSKSQEEHPSIRSIRNDVMNRKIQQSKGRGKETTVTQKDNTRTVTPKIGKIATGKEKEQRAIEENKQVQEASELQARKDWVQESMEKAYKSPLMSPGYFTPEGAAIGALQGAFKMPGHIAEGDYKGAALDALMILPETGNIAKTLGPSESLLSKFKPKQKYTLPEPEPFIQLDINNPTAINLERTAKANKNIYKETIIDGNLQINKRGGTPENPKTITVKTKTGNIQAVQNPDGSYMFHNDVGSKIDAGKAMLKLNEHFPNNPNIFETSSMSTDSYTNLLKIGKNKDWVATPEGFSPLNDANKNVNFLDDLFKWKNRGANAAFPSEKNALEAQRRMTDYLNKHGYNESPNIFEKHGEWQMEIPNFRVKRNYKQGGIIKDDRGQWGEHKGEPTRINQSELGSYIDMGPDPLTGKPLTQPLLGISDKGERKIMYPGEKHKYKKGTKYVDEFPIAKNGLRQEQKGLQNLDQLTNWSNYNTKQKGGWLDNL